MSYKSHIFVCTNERLCGHKRGCCFEKGSVDLRNYMKLRVKELKLDATRVNASGCLDHCEQGVAMVIYPEGIWYTPKTREDIDEIITHHLQGGTPVVRLIMKDSSL